MTVTATPPTNPAARRPIKPYPMQTDREKWDAYMKRWGRLQTERSSWITHWMDLGRHCLPRSPRFFSSDRNRGGKAKYNSIYDNTATRSVRVLSAGMMAGMTSPARPWFRLTVRDAELRKDQAVQEWLDMVVERMRFVFQESNVYRRLPQKYEELGVFGVSASLILSDFDKVIRMYPLNVGEYALAQDWQGRIVTCYREFERTVSEVVKEFGYENCSTAVQTLYDNRGLDQWVKILHVVEPRADQGRDLSSPSVENMPWRSVYMEQSTETQNILRESGFRRMRIVAPRWQVTGNDVYGVSPAMEALGDVRQLQQMQLRFSQAIDYQTLPPLQVPTAMKDRSSREQLPGGRSYFEPASVTAFDQVGPQGGIRTAFEVGLDTNGLQTSMAEVQVRIKKAFYEDLFLMLATRDRQGNMTATEVLERQEEKLLMIGPVLERMSNELLSPLIDITFLEMLEAGMIPLPPPQLAGTELNVEFISILAQAQQAVGIAGVQQYMNDALAVAGAGRPDVLDNINFDEWARITAEMRGVPAQLMVPQDSVDQLRQARADAEAAREQAALAEQGAGTVQKLSASPVNQNSALDQFLSEAAGVPAA